MPRRYTAARCTAHSTIAPAMHGLRDPLANRSLEAPIPSSANGLQPRECSETRHPSPPGAAIPKFSHRLAPGPSLSGECSKTRENTSNPRRVFGVCSGMDKPNKEDIRALRFWHGWKWGDIAGFYGISPSEARRVAGVRGQRRRHPRSKRPDGLRAWSLAVRDRDGRRCVECGATGRLHAHHIVPISENPELALDLGNGQTLCPPCHAAKHPEISRIIK